MNKYLSNKLNAYLASSLAACGAAYTAEISDKELVASLKYSYSDIKYGLDAEALLIAWINHSCLLM